MRRQFGDKLQLSRGWGGGRPSSGVAPAAVDAGNYATLPKAARCLRDGRTATQTLTYRRCG